MLLGSVVGGYRILEIVGEGGMGTVCRAVDVLLEREVALKLLRPELTDQPDLVARFRTEAVALARLNHPHIVTVHHLFRDGEQYFMVLEFVRGETIDKLISRCAPIPWQTAVPLICQSLNGLEHAHILKVIHRDIKPSNLILTEQNTVKIMDFGIARMLETDGVTQAGNILGTVKYMSPEQITGQEIDFRADIYGIGAVLYEMISGRPPYSKQSEYELIRAKVEEPPEPLRKLIPSVPRQLDAVILKALAQDPTHRFQSAAIFRAELQSILDDPFCEQEGAPIPAADYKTVEPAIGRGQELPTYEIGDEDFFHAVELADPEDEPADAPVTIDPASPVSASETSTTPILEPREPEDKTLVPAETSSSLARRESGHPDGRWWSHEDERAVDAMIAGLADRSTGGNTAALLDEPPWGVTAAAEAMLRQAEDQPTIFRRYPLLTAASVLLPILAVAFVIGFAYTGNEGPDEAALAESTSSTPPVATALMSERAGPEAESPVDVTSVAPVVPGATDAQRPSMSGEHASPPSVDPNLEPHPNVPAESARSSSQPDVEVPSVSAEPKAANVMPNIQLPAVTGNLGVPKQVDGARETAETAGAPDATDAAVDLAARRKAQALSGSDGSRATRRVARRVASRPEAVHRAPAPRMVANKVERRASPEPVRRSGRVGHRSKLARNGAGGSVRDGGWTIVTE